MDSNKTRVFDDRDLVCPILHEIMVEPVIAADGHTNEKVSLSRRMGSYSKSPMTNHRLIHHYICENFFAKKVINEYHNAKKFDYEPIEEETKRTMEENAKLGNKNSQLEQEINEMQNKNSETRLKRLLII